MDIDVHNNNNNNNNNIIICSYRVHFHPQCTSHGKKKERKIRKISSLDDIKVLYVYIHVHIAHFKILGKC